MYLRVSGDWIRTILASFKDSDELHGNALKLWIQEAVTHDRVMRKGRKKKNNKTPIQIIAWVAKMQTPAEVAAHSPGLNVRGAF